MSTTMTQDEEFVRANWQRAEFCPSALQPYKCCLSLGGIGFTRANIPETWAQREEEAWAAAAEFTRKRLRQIAEVEEERGMLCGKLLLEDKDIAIMKRILARLESAVADLRRGMSGGKAEAR